MADDQYLVEGKSYWFETELVAMQSGYIVKVTEVLSVLETYSQVQGYKN
jgi:hypothetical protein